LNILIIDDHPLIREAVRNVLARLGEDIEVLEAEDCDSALRIVDAHANLDLILLDLGLPRKGGLEVLLLLREQHPIVPVVVLSANTNRDIVVEALDRGAMGFIPKSSSNEVMLGALRLVLSGGVYLPPAIFIPKRTEMSPDVTVAGPNTLSDLRLTERQLQVLALMVQGKSNKLICRELGVAESTIKVYVTAILKALNVVNRTQAVIAVSQMGIKLQPAGKPIRF
jgi:DNA-binding NarL/FixJ family response regulator